MNVSFQNYPSTQITKLPFFSPLPYFFFFLPHWPIHFPTTALILSLTDENGFWEWYNNPSFTTLFRFWILYGGWVQFLRRKLGCGWDLPAVHCGELPIRGARVQLCQKWASRFGLHKVQVAASPLRFIQVNLHPSVIVSSFPIFSLFLFLTISFKK